MKSSVSLDRSLHRRLVDGLYIEAMVMADEARSYFDAPETQDFGADDPLRRVAFACESLKVTTRLMHVIAWLLSQRAWQRGEIADTELADEKHRLGHAAPTDAAVSEGFPFSIRALVEGSQELYDRVARLQDRLDRMMRLPAPGEDNPAHALMNRLSSAF
ncbi:DUF1465 family protein [Sphingobium ummariense]